MNAFRGVAIAQRLEHQTVRLTLTMTEICDGLDVESPIEAVPTEDTPSPT